MGTSLKKCQQQDGKGSNAIETVLKETLSGTRAIDSYLEIGNQDSYEEIDERQHRPQTRDTAKYYRPTYE